MNAVENYDVCASGYSSLRRGEYSLDIFPGLLKKIIKNRMWEQRLLPNGKLIELCSLAELITKPPMDGWGEDPKKVEYLIRDNPDALTMFRKAMKHQGKKNFVNNVNEVESSKGNTRSYTLSRLQRERDDLYDQVCEGKLSANAAAIKAGFRKKPTPYEQIIKLLTKLTPDEKSQLCQILLVEMGKIAQAKSTGK